ncbi:uncharacterized protein [Leptinotarsa decemlineata]|uniref:uncharacterized protein n=1 Tax=Leptinotarsa decemlineata TaxID=7539 RepID=UPI003D30B0BF
MVSQQILNKDSNYSSSDSDTDTLDATNNVGNDAAQIYGKTSSREERSELNQLSLNEDSDDSVKDPDYSANNTSESEKEEETENEKEKQLTRWKRSHPSDWKRNIAKKRRSDGLNYKINKRQRPPKNPERSIVKNVVSNVRLNSQMLKGKLFVHNIVKWTISKDKKISYFPILQACLQRGGNGNRGPRSNSKQYYFKEKKNKMRICQAFFLKTLSISGDVVRNAFQNKRPAGTYIGEDKRGKSVSGNKTVPEIVAAVKDQQWYHTILVKLRRKITWTVNYLFQRCTVSTKKNVKQ